MDTSLKRGNPMQRIHPEREADSESDYAPDFASIRNHLLEAQAAARTLYELYPDPKAIEPLYQALASALAEVAHEARTRAGGRVKPVRGGGPFVP
jgi:hypothetical protein